ncbi:F-box protein At5g49610-like [Primulina tabacum]|uniref:F-box protein At5g49610-like n=1 Tax=Primulina tabacum TaxID=48773 RepID=UPI003F5AB153
MADADDATEPKTAGSINPYIFHCCKSCARKRRTKYLPQEVFFEFLSYLSAQVLYDVMRHVCKEWNLIIRSRVFINHHLRNSATGIIIQECLPLADNVVYVEMRRGCMEISKLDYRFKNLVWTSCNGLVLSYDPRDRQILYVINPLTKQWAVLPPYLHKIIFFPSFGLAFCEASMEYKVVYACGEEFLNPRTRIHVLTVGVDKVWRCIDINPFDGIAYRSPFVTGGYVHFIGQTVVLTFNVETEAVCRFSLPQLIASTKRGKFMAMGSNLSFFCVTTKFLTDVWEMNPKTGEWIMTLKIDLKPVRHRFKEISQVKNFSSLFPCCWLVVREVLLFCDWYPTRHCIAYNVKTREIRLIELSADAKRHHFRGHVNSLVSLEGGF